MTSGEGADQTAPHSQDPGTLARDIENTREEMAHTAQQLLSKTDLTSRALDKARELEARGSEKTAALLTRAHASAPELTETTQRGARWMGQRIRDHPGAAAGVAAGLFTFLKVRKILRRRRAQEKLHRQ